MFSIQVAGSHNITPALRTDTKHDSTQVQFQIHNYIRCRLFEPMINYPRLR